MFFFHLLIKDAQNRDRSLSLNFGVFERKQQQDIPSQVIGGKMTILVLIPYLTCRLDLSFYALFMPILLFYVVLNNVKACS